MRKFEYVIPGETTIKRRFEHDILQRDCFDVLIAGELVATLDYATARRYWLGRLPLSDILAGQQKRPPEKVK